jgi:hypothetical protein
MTRASPGVILFRDPRARTPYNPAVRGGTNMNPDWPRTQPGCTVDGYDPCTRVDFAIMKFWSSGMP